MSGTIIVFMCVIFLCHGFVATHDCSHFAVGYGIGTALLQELAKVSQLGSVGCFKWRFVASYFRFYNMRSHPVFKQFN